MKGLVCRPRTHYGAPTRSRPVPCAGAPATPGPGRFGRGLPTEPAAPQLVARPIPRPTIGSQLREGTGLPPSHPLRGANPVKTCPLRRCPSHTGPRLVWPGPCQHRAQAGLAGAQASWPGPQPALLSPSARDRSLRWRRRGAVLWVRTSPFTERRAEGGAQDRPGYQLGPVLPGPGLAGARCCRSPGARDRSLRRRRRDAVLRVRTSPFTERRAEGRAQDRPGYQLGPGLAGAGLAGAPAQGTGLYVGGAAAPCCGRGPVPSPSDEPTVRLRIGRATSWGLVLPGRGLAGAPAQGTGLHVGGAAAPS